MRDRDLSPMWWAVAAAGMFLLPLGAMALAQQDSSKSSSREKDAEPVVRKFGTEGGYRTEVSSRTTGTLSDEDRRQVSLLMAQVFEHIEKARDAIDADEPKRALSDVDKAREAVKTIRAMLPKTTVRVRTVAPDGKVVYEDESADQESRIPLFEGMLHAQTLAPILAARRHALEVAGLRVVESEAIVTEAIADVDTIEGQLKRAAKALQEDKTETAGKALNRALIQGIEIRFRKEDSELASARDAIWLARRSLEENNVAQALVNLETAKARLRLYREVVSADQRQEVDQMLQEVQQLEVQLRQEATQPVTRGERNRQGSMLTHWWDRINGWFRRHL